MKKQKKTSKKKREKNLAIKLKKKNNSIKKTYVIHFFTNHVKKSLRLLYNRFVDVFHVLTIISAIKMVRSLTKPKTIQFHLGLLMQ